MNARVSDPADTASTAGVRTVPLLSSGALSDNVATVNQAGSRLIFYLPASTAGGVSFTNGVTVSLGVALASYTMTIPGSGSNINTVNFPSGSGPLNTFSFNALGDEPFSAIGSGTGTAVQVTTKITFSPMVITSATLSVTSGLGA